MITIKNDRLTIKMAEPNVELNTARFNRAGFIVSAVLDGKTEYCGDEHGGTGGYGLCSEIATDVNSESVAIGEKFIKFGVGLLTKFENRRYDAMNPYEVTPFPIAYEAKEDSVTFTTVTPLFDGFAAKEVKTVSVKDNILTVKTTFANTGDKPFTYAEYNHNFLTTDYSGVRNNYNLYMHATHEDLPYSWRIHFTQERAAIVAKDSFRPHHFNIWSPGFVISPEIWISEDLLPGQSVNYTRSWEFQTDVDQ